MGLAEEAFFYWEWAVSFRGTHRPVQNGVHDVPPKGTVMILPVVVVLKEIYEKGRDYVWPRPQVCPKCKAGRPWGHGFVLACFDGFSAALLLRRYRCPHCGCVIRLKPEGYFPRFQSSIETIRTIIGDLLEKRPAGRGVSRTRSAHWLGALRRKTKAYLGDPFGHRLLEAFDRLMEMGKIPVGRSI
jgi:hypothetical protein